MEYRAGLPQDLPDLERLVVQLGYPGDPIKNLFSLYRNDPSMGVWVALVEKRVRGLLAFHVFPQFHGGGYLFRIVSLVVDRECRRQGIGAFLLEQAEREARKRGCVGIELTSALHRNRDGSHDFYRTHGYRDSGICGKCYFCKIF